MVEKPPGNHKSPSKSSDTLWFVWAEKVADHQFFRVDTGRFPDMGDPQNALFTVEIIIKD